MRLDRKSLALITWFGPRGLSSLLLVLLPVFAGLPEGARLFSICHPRGAVLGGDPRRLADAVRVEGRHPPEPVSRNRRKLPRRRRPRKVSLRSWRRKLRRSLPQHAPARIGIEELKALQAAGEPVVILDVRKPRTLERARHTAAGAARIDPERAVQDAERLRLPREAWLVAFCA